MKSEVANLRINYSLNELLEGDIEKKPVDQFSRWFLEAKSSEIIEPNAMVLSTVSDNKPKSRVVLLKGFDERGFTFFTNYLSHKGQELAENPFASLTFFWDKLQRQVRIEGKIEKLSEQESDEYFESRPKGSQIGAWVSEQSQVILGREVLENKQKELDQKYDSNAKVPRPAHWGGYLLVVDTIEFWQGRPSRLHDRIRYRLIEGNWVIDRLSP
ncbi:Pyridoxamine 5'-phosphate oxidase [Spirosomataceae bacterium TFI 002]|nr:Pyridoxamine 5'-phosphate oxidase [Spirosomataceae bacterium TFI 002]